MSDIAERMLTKTGEEDRIANFASRVADGLDQEKSAAFKPTPDYIKNKKIAIQLAKRYIDDYKKMQKDPGFADEIRMDPADLSLIHILLCRRIERCRSRWSPYH